MYRSEGREDQPRPSRLDQEQGAWVKERTFKENADSVLMLALSKWVQAPSTSAGTRNGAAPLCSKDSSCGM
jgi:hypothetical protein